MRWRENAMNARAAPEDSSMSYNRIRLPQSAPAQPIPAAFLLWPCAGLLAPTPEQAALYTWALEQARAVVQPSLPERDLAGTWN